MTLTLTSPDPAKDASDVIELCARTFGRYYDFRRNLRNWYLLNSHYDWAASAIGRLGSDLVTHYGVWDYQMRIGRSLVRCGGIGCVATDGEHRKKGLMAQTVPHSLARMQQRGYDLTILFGVADFYHRFGYVRAWNETRWVINRDRLPKDLPAVRLSAFDPNPSPEIARLHNRFNATVTGSAVRPTFAKGLHTFHAKPEGFAWRDKAGRILGYVVIQPGQRLSCAESVGQPDQVLSALASLAHKKESREIQFDTLPYPSALARRLRQLSCSLEKQYVESGSAMVRLLNLPQCLQKMTPELEHRLHNSELADYRGDLTLHSPAGRATLQIKNKRITVSPGITSKNQIRGDHSLAQLILGSDEPMEICESAKITLRGEAQRLLPILFPNQHPQLHLFDRY